MTHEVVSRDWQQQLNIFIGKNYLQQIRKWEIQVKKNGDKTSNDGDASTLVMFWVILFKIIIIVTHYYCEWTILIIFDEICITSEIRSTSHIFKSTNNTFKQQFF